jgi:hypothetical protein
MMLWITMLELPLIAISIGVGRNVLQRRYKIEGIKCSI